MTRHHAIPCVLLALAATVALTGCTNPYAASKATPRSSASTGVQNAGEPPAPAPASSSTQSPTDVQATPQSAIVQFADLYSNWTYRTLAREQLALAAMSTGAARLAERQAAGASESDSTIARARLSNQGQVLAVAPDLARAGWWIVATREQTSGSGEYEGLASSDHVTLVQLAHVNGGYTVTQWLPAS